MNLYESLKSGISAEELIEKFKSELESAQEQLDREQEKKKQEEHKIAVAAAQSDLWQALKRFIETVAQKTLTEKEWKVAEEVFADTMKLAIGALGKGDSNPAQNFKNIKELSNILPFLFL